MPVRYKDRPHTSLLLRELIARFRDVVHDKEIGLSFCSDERCRNCVNPDACSANPTQHEVQFPFQQEGRRFGCRKIFTDWNCSENCGREDKKGGRAAAFVDAFCT
jgi:hypothetical protein